LINDAKFQALNADPFNTFTVGHNWMSDMYPSEIAAINGFTPFGNEASASVGGGRLLEGEDDSNSRLLEDSAEHDHADDRNL
jgi:hypothetical protein